MLATAGSPVTNASATVASVTVLDVVTVVEGARRGGGWGRHGGRLPAGPVLDGQADGGAALPVDLDVGEGRDADEVDVGRRHEAAGDGDGFDRLIERAGAHDLDVDSAGLPQDARQRAGDRVRVGLAGDLQYLDHFSPRNDVGLHQFDGGHSVSCVARFGPAELRVGGASRQVG